MGKIFPSLFLVQKGLGKFYPTFLLYLKGFEIFSPIFFSLKRVWVNSSQPFYFILKVGKNFPQSFSRSKRFGKSYLTFLLSLKGSVLFSPIFFSFKKVWVNSSEPFYFILKVRENFPLPFSRSKRYGLILPNLLTLS